MFGIGQFFSKIQNSFAKEVLIRTVMKDAIKKYVGLEIPIENISVKSGTITLDNVSQSARSAIFIKKQAIIKEIMAAQNIKNITDIR